MKLGKQAGKSEVEAAWREWQPLQAAGIHLPTAPSHPVLLLDGDNRPQPRLDRDIHRGMVSVVGRLRPDPILDYKFVVLGHNLDRGAAGGTLLLAELLHRSGLLD